MVPDAEVRAVLRRYRDVSASARVLPLGNAGGFSGAALWRIESAEQTLCLRRWPELPDTGTLQQIHAVLVHVVARGFPLVPLPFCDQTGETVVLHAGARWELTPWLPGRADYREQPTKDRLCAALESLARFHNASASFQSQMGPSPGLARREQMLRESIEQGPMLLRATQQFPNESFRNLALPLLAEVLTRGPLVLRQLRDAPRRLTLLQCIRDIQHDHVLFKGQQVSGLIDFGAMRLDCASGDIARLLGSMMENDASSWQCGIEAYQSARKLTAQELQAIPVFDASGTLLSVVNWIRWLAVERREFEDFAAVLQRLELLRRRLSAATSAWQTTDARSFVLRTT